MSETETNFKEGIVVHKGKLHQWYKVLLILKGLECLLLAISGAYNTHIATCVLTGMYIRIWFKLAKFLNQRH